MHVQFLFSYSSIRFSEFSFPGRKRVEGWREVKGITLMEPHPHGRKHQELVTYIYIFVYKQNVYILYIYKMHINCIYKYILYINNIFIFILYNINIYILQPYIYYFLLLFQFPISVPHCIVEPRTTQELEALTPDAIKNPQFWLPRNLSANRLLLTILITLIVN